MAFNNIFYLILTLNQNILLGSIDTLLKEPIHGHQYWEEVYSQ